MIICPFEAPYIQRVGPVKYTEQGVTNVFVDRKAISEHRNSLKTTFSIESFDLPAIV